MRNRLFVILALVLGCGGDYNPEWGFKNESISLESFTFEYLESLDSFGSEGKLRDMRINYNGFAVISMDNRLISRPFSGKREGSWLNVGPRFELIRDVIANNNAYAMLVDDHEKPTDDWNLRLPGGFLDSNQLSGKDGLLQVEQSFDIDILVLPITSDQKSTIDGASSKVVTWGDPDSGGISEEVGDILNEGVDHLYRMENAFAALTSSGTLVIWGFLEGHALPIIEANIKQVVRNEKAIVALKDDGTVKAWGDPLSGADFSSVSKYLHGIVRLRESTYFKAENAEGEIFAWGLGLYLEPGDEHLNWGNSKPSESKIIDRYRFNSLEDLFSWEQSSPLNRAFFGKDAVGLLSTIEIILEQKKYSFLECVSITRDFKRGQLLLHEKILVDSKGDARSLNDNRFPNVCFDRIIRSISFPPAKYGIYGFSTTFRVK